MDGEHCSVCQRSVVPPSVELVEAAFERLPGLTAVDAKLAVQQGFGILAERLSSEAANEAAAHLLAAGYECAVVPESALELPKAFHLRRADLLDSGFVTYDVYGRPTKVEWSDVVLAHVGTYREGTIERTKDAGWIQRGEFVVSWDSEHEVVESDVTVLEIVAADPRKRFALVPSPFDYRYLEARKSNDSRKNFAALICDLSRLLASSPARPLARLASDGRSVAAIHRYPSRRLFERHLKWLSWSAVNQR